MMKLIARVYEWLFNRISRAQISDLELVQIMSYVKKIVRINVVHMILTTNIINI